MFYVYSFIYGTGVGRRQSANWNAWKRSPSRMWWSGPTNTSVPKVTPSSTNAKARTPASRRSQPRKSRPIATNRDAQSAFLAEIQNTEVKPIEPVFVDYKKDMSRFEARKGIDVLYKKNESNDIFTLTYVFDTGTENDPALNLAFDYLGYLGSESLTAEQIASKMYGIACSFSMQAGPTIVPHLDYGTEREYGRSHGNRRGTAEQAQARRGDSRQPQGRHDQEPRRRQAQPEPLLRRPANATCSTVRDFIRRTTLTNPALASDEFRECCWRR